jgi:hypothetical protein
MRDVFGIRGERRIFLSVAGEGWKFGDARFKGQNNLSWLNGSG